MVYKFCLGMSFMVSFSFREWAKEWKTELKEHKWLLILSIILIIIANILNVTAATYSDRMGSAHVADIILDNIPAVNLQYVFTFGFTFAIAILFLYPLFFRVRQVHLVISQFSLLLIVRAFFIILTHLKQPIDAIVVDLPQIYSALVFKNDLFFSGHVAMTFLGFLLFKEDKIFGTFFLIVTIIMAVTVLLMHVHYSIDVFAAFFITYGTYKFGKWCFKKVQH